MPIDIYDLYKPLRNYMRQFNLIPSLTNIWAYSQHLTYDRALPKQLQFTNTYGLPINMKKIIFPWDLDIITRELILNAGNRGLTLGNQEELTKVINHLRYIDNEISKRRQEDENYDILFDLHRLGNWQFEAQKKPRLASLIRYHKINKYAGVEPLIFKKLGLDLGDVFRIGLATAGSLTQHPIVNLEQDYTTIGVDHNKRNSFYQRLTCTLPALKEELQENAEYTEKWLYTWNPLVLKPLISFDEAQSHLALVPLAMNFLNRFTSGIYYDIVKEKDFDNSYGESLQKYVGEVIGILCPSPKFTVTPEYQYYDGKNLKHGVDWIISDKTGHLFIECKTKRLTLQGKLAKERADLYSDLKIMAKYIVQHYKNILDAEQKKTVWTPDGKPIFFLIITLEQWWLFSPRITDELKNLVIMELQENNVDETIIERIPYKIGSLSDFETSCQTIAREGLNPYFDLKLDINSNPLALASHNIERFQEQKEQNILLFEDEFKSLMRSWSGFGNTSSNPI